MLEYTVIGLAVVAFPGVIAGFQGKIDDPPSQPDHRKHSWLDNAINEVNIVTMKPRRRL